jgi:carbon storage regulator
MLVLTRKKHESIQIGDIKITVVTIGSKYVRIGIDAPKDVVVARTELIQNCEWKPKGNGNA